MLYTLVAFFSLQLPAAELNGVVKFKGKAPAPVPLRMNADPVCLKQSEGKSVFNEEMIVSQEGGLQNVFVYVKEGVSPTGNGAALPPVVLDQLACRYIPRVLGIHVDQTLKILNSDPTLHNVHAMVKKNSGFNVGMPNKGKVIEKKFSKPEVMIRLKCDVHGWMSAFVGVLDHPYYATTNEKGEFQIANLPRGEYVIETWHEKLGTKTVKLTVPESSGKRKMEVEYP